MRAFLVSCEVQFVSSAAVTVSYQYDVRRARVGERDAAVVFDLDRHAALGVAAPNLRVAAPDLRVAATDLRVAVGAEALRAGADLTLHIGRPPAPRRYNILPVTIAECVRLEEEQKPSSFISHPG